MDTPLSYTRNSNIILTMRHIGASHQSTSITQVRNTKPPQTNVNVALAHIKMKYRNVIIILNIVKVYVSYLIHDDEIFYFYRDGVSA